MVSCLILSVPRTEYQLPRLQWGAHVAYIPKAQATRIIDRLAEDGFLDSAKDLITKSGIHRKQPRPKGPACTLHVRGPEKLGLLANFGWDLKMIRRLEALRAVLKGDAAKAMDKLLARLAPLKKKWEK